VSSSPSGPSFGSVPETLVDEEIVIKRSERLSRGAVVGRYVILEPLGRGGMGEVFAAYDPELDRKIAIKILKRERTDSTRSQSRMMREAQALAKLSHTNVVAIHDVGTHDDRVFVAMEFVEGETLREWVKAKKPSWREIVGVAVQAGRGLAAAHDKSLVHRDFKPDNVMVGADGVARVLDFGLAHAHGARSPEERGDTESEEEADGPLRTSTLDTPLTRVGAVIGTPAYMSPEQHLGQPTEAATDQFSFCVTVYEMLYGEGPHDGETQESRAYAVTLGNIRDAPKNSQVPGWVRRILLRGMLVKPQERYPDMVSLLAELSRDPAAARRKWGLVAGAGAVVVAGTVGLSTLAPSDQDACGDGQAHLAGVWDDDARGKMKAAFESTDRVYAARSFDVAAAVLDDYASAWTATSVDACEATRVRKELSEEAFDLRMRCLGQRKADLQALVEVFAEADGEVVDNSIQATDALPSLGVCSDVVALRARTPPPTDPQVRGRIEDVEMRLAQSRALVSAGKYARAAEVARGAAEEARAVDYQPVQAVALGCLGRALEADGKPEEAEHALIDAAVAAEVSGDDQTLADIRILLAVVVGDRLQRTDDGHLWAKLAKASLERIGGDPRREATLENNIGLILDEEGKFEEELEHKLRALELLEQAESATVLQRAGIHNAVASVMAQLGDFAGGTKHAQQAVDMLEAEVGGDHPQVGLALGGLALTNDYAGRYDVALPLYKKALDNLESALGPEHPKLADVLNNYAIAQINTGDYPGGEETFRRVLEIHRRSFGEQHPAVAQAHVNLGGLLRMQERHDEARDSLEAALRIRRATLDPEHPDIAGSLASLANLYEDTGLLDKSIEYRIESLALIEQNYGPNSVQLLVDLGNLAYTQANMREREAAVSTAKRALAILQRNEVQPDVAAFTKLSMAKALTADGRDRPEARDYADQALEILEGMAAPWERKLLADLAKEIGWKEARYHQAPGK
jgi:tetratricopeptide (TPR) repeat protein